MDSADVLIFGLICALVFVVGFTFGSVDHASYSDFCDENGMQHIDMDERGNYCITEKGNTLIAKPIERKNNKVYWVNEE